jgi:hypothetical protein
MKKCFLLPVLIFSLVVLNRCSTEFDINADWKDITVVYGLLDQTEAMHYIRVNKAFLGKGNALQMAQEFDSTNYKKDELEVKLEEYQSNPNLGEPKNSFKLTWDTTSKDLGIFYDPKMPVQTVYKTSQKLSENYIYKLVIANLKTGKTVYSQTNLIYPFTILRPKAGDRFNFIGKQEVNWTSAKYGRAYQLIIRFHFDEINKITKVITPKYVDWVFPKQTVTNLNGGQPMKYIFQAEELFYIISSRVSINNDVRRKPGAVDFMFIVAGDDFNTFLDVNAPSNSVVQEKPGYTNISNGIGIFSCRYKNSKTIDLSSRSIDSLVLGRYTGKLGFYNPIIP